MYKTQAMKRIIIPTDFSENAFNAIAYALQLFAEESCTFYLVHTYTPITQYVTSIYESNTSVNLDLGKMQEENAEKEGTRAGREL